MNRYFIIFIFWVFVGAVQAQEASFLWYNCENLFHPENDSLVNDDAFTPEGDYHWTYNKYYSKVKSIGKVLLAISEWNTPAVIGLCEIENEKCVKDLVYNSPLEGLKLKYLHKNSPDRRGIDVALLYDPDQFQMLKVQFIELKKPDNLDYRTRDILYAKGILSTSDTIHVFVNHWPSKYGGAVASEANRILAAQTLLFKVDSIRNANENANIVAMGDFNETVDEPALLQVKATGMIPLENEQENIGSHKFHGIWSQIDYFIVAPAILSAENSIQLRSWKIAQPTFVLEPDETYNGIKPYRTNIGYKYHGGISDHLPLVLYLQKH